jgi:hypothetical protein
MAEFPPKHEGVNEEICLCTLDMHYVGFINEKFSHNVRKE